MEIFVIYLDITDSSSKLKSSIGELLVDKVVRAFYFALLRLGNFKTSGCLVGRPTCAPAITSLTPLLVGTFTISYNT